MEREILQDDIVHFFSDRQNIYFSIPLFCALGQETAVWITLFYTKRKWDNSDRWDEEEWDRDPRDRSEDSLFNIESIESFMQKEARIPPSKNRQICQRLIRLGLLSIKEINGIKYYDLPITKVIRYVKDFYERNPSTPFNQEDIRKGCDEDGRRGDYERRKLDL